MATKSLASIRRASFASLLIWSLINIPPASNADDALPPIEIVRAGYTEAISSIQTVDADFELHWKALSKSIPVTDRVFTLHRIHLARDAVRTMVQVESVNADGSSKVRTWAAFDGDRYFEQNDSFEKAADNPLPTVGTIRTVPPTSLSAYPSVDRFMGVSNDGSLSLKELLSRQEAQVIGLEDFDGTACVLVSLGRHGKSKESKDEDLDTKVWLDRTRSYLPRRIRTERSRAGQRESQLLSELEVLEFQDIHVANLNRTLLVQSRGVARGPFTEFQYKLNRIELNRSLSDDMFQPKFPPGTQVMQETTPGRPRTQVVDAANSRPMLDVGTASNSTQSMPKDPVVTTHGEAIDATPRKTPVMLWLGILAAGCFLVAFVLWMLCGRR